MPDQRRHNSGEHHSQSYVPPVPHVSHKLGWWRRRRLSSLIGALLLAVAIAAAFWYAFKMEATREREVTHGTH